jgi:hypothetical protein
MPPRHPENGHVSPDDRNSERGADPDLDRCCRAALIRFRGVLFPGLVRPSWIHVGRGADTIVEQPRKQHARNRLGAKFRQVAFLALERRASGHTEHDHVVVAAK